MAYLLDLQIEFRQLQRARYPEMSEREWLDLFALWLAQHHAKTDMRTAALLAERATLQRVRRAAAVAARRRGRAAQGYRDGNRGDRGAALASRGGDLG